MLKIISHRYLLSSTPHFQKHIYMQTEQLQKSFLPTSVVFVGLLNTNLDSRPITVLMLLSQLR